MFAHTRHRRTIFLCSTALDCFVLSSFMHTVSSVFRNRPAPSYTDQSDAVSEAALSTINLVLDRLTEETQSYLRVVDAVPESEKKRPDLPSSPSMGSSNLASEE